MSQLYISMYHYTRDLKYSRYPGIKALSTQMFRQQIEYMKNNFNIVTMEQVIDAIESHSNLPDRALLLTFDDGYIDNYLCAFPILEEFEVQGSFFIPGKTFSAHELLDVNKIHYILASTNISTLVKDLKLQMDFYRGREYVFASTMELYGKYAVATRFDNADTIFFKTMLQVVLPEKLRTIIVNNLFEKYMEITEECLAHELYLTEDQIRTMKRHGMYIGVHGYEHYWLGHLSNEEMVDDISRALNVMDEFIDKKHWVMNYPYGDYSDNVVEYVKSAGACVGLTTDVRIADIKKDCALKLPRLDCNDFPPKSNDYK